MYIPLLELPPLHYNNPYIGEIVNVGYLTEHQKIEKPQTYKSVKNQEQENFFQYLILQKIVKSLQHGAFK